MLMQLVLMFLIEDSNRRAEVKNRINLIHSNKDVATEMFDKKKRKEEMENLKDKPMNERLVFLKKEFNKFIDEYIKKSEE